MKIGIFSDTHGNLEATEAALRHLEQAGAERLWCLGDVVGYGANPNECVDRVRAAAEETILGNHDAACSGAVDPAAFNRYAREAVDWTAQRLTPERRDWLRALPQSVTKHDLLLVHASPVEPALWHYIHPHMRLGDMVACFEATAARVTFVGHSHQPMVLVHRGADYFRFSGDQLYLEDGGRYLVNVGSVGQPRDGNPLGCAAVYDTEAASVRLVRFPYDVAAAARKIREAGLPDVLADRLETGN